MVINVFYKHAFLYNFTISILYFLQIIYVNAAGSSSDAGEALYKCDDGRTHFLADKVYYLKNSQEAAPIAAIYVEKAGTVVNASQITVYGDNPDKISSYGAYVSNGGKLNLIATDFKDIPALRAQNAVISMTVGEIKGVSHAVYAWGRETDISLVSVNIDVQPDNLKVKRIGIMSGFDAMIRMSDGTVNFNQIGSFSTRFGGRYILDTMGITGQGKREEARTDGDGAMGVLPEAFEIFQGGDVHLKNSFIHLNNMYAFFIKNFSSYVDDNGKLIQKYVSPDGFKNTSVKIERSNISVKGEGAHGLYFHILSPEDLAKISGQQNNEKILETKKVLTGKAFVRLYNTDFAVPDGIAIYSTGSNGYGSEGILELSGETRISGDLLLKAESNSSLFVKANASSLKGGTRVEDISRAGLELKRSSTWYLTKSRYEGLQEKDSTDSSISYVSLSDSTIVFDKHPSGGYQTLRIGKKINAAEEDKILYDLLYKKAYSAKGNVQIKLSTFLDDDGLFDPQQTDRILIYGDVSGNTLVHIENFQKNSYEEVRDGRDQSISLIQVSGIAQEDSFKLASAYTTVNGFPYQYHLRGYGPSSSFGTADAKQRLVEGEGDFWDFRLEGIYINPDPDSSETVSPTPSPYSPFEPGDTSSFEPSVPVDPSLTPSTSNTSSPSASSEPGGSPSSGSSAPVDPSLTPSTSNTSSPSASSEPGGSPSSGSSAPVDPSLTPSTSDTSSPFAPSEPGGSSSSGSSAPVDPSLTPSTSDTSSPSAPSEPGGSPSSKPSAPVDPSLTPSTSDTSSPSAPSEPGGSPSSKSSAPVDPSPTPSVPVKPDIHSKLEIMAVVPQVPTYLLLPNALFQAGLMDLTAQNRKLEKMRIASGGSLKSGENTAFFLHAYGGSHHYASNLSAFEYGYGAELDYTALEAGVLLKEIESLYSRTFFGVTGTYGSLSLHPLNVEQRKKSPFDKWSVATYGSMQHDAGFYMDGLLSYGLFRGDVLTLARGKAATLKGKQLNAFMTSGKTFAIGHAGVVFDPQVQLIYQRLQFDRVCDVDDLDIDMGKFNQWTARAGGRLTKFLAPFEGGRAVSFYGKLYFMRSFGDRQFVSFKNDFQLGDFGSSLEAGLGFNAKLSSKFVFHGDINYQHRLTKAGFSGASFSAGLRHLF
ncbi:autotransporter outer membrane beta-barrel domain-containing protein [Bartonella sp. B23]